jgi:hypothetical protein
MNDDNSHLLIKAINDDLRLLRNLIDAFVRNIQQPGHFEGHIQDLARAINDTSSRLNARLVELTKTESGQQ